MISDLFGNGDSTKEVGYVTRFISEETGRKISLLEQETTLGESCFSCRTWGLQNGFDWRALASPEMQAYSAMDNYGYIRLKASQYHRRWKPYWETFLLFRAQHDFRYEHYPNLYNASQSPRSSKYCLAQGSTIIRHNSAWMEWLSARSGVHHERNVSLSSPLCQFAQFWEQPEQRRRAPE